MTRDDLLNRKSSVCRFESSLSDTVRSMTSEGVRSFKDNTGKSESVSGIRISGCVG